ncbi:uncharacterized protein LOC129233872 [Uloborus diversus]|uniref:uncharacterized protein LOC129233872 n=1 Tax=Uloborus diversus TaxID=327109 RepID=UPI002409F608|nr:uncharacterized protein LOC129233872 [Uloborus diversus]
MKTYCCVPFCKSKSAKGNGISFHEFPSKFSVRAEWLRFISLDKSTITDGKNYNRVCSLHFKSTDFVITLQRRRLSSYAVPSLLEPNADTAIQEKCKFKSRTSGKKCSSLKQKKINVRQTDDQVSEKVADPVPLSSVANSSRRLNKNAVRSISPSYTENNTPTAKHKKCKFKSRASRKTALKQKEIEAPQTDAHVSENIAEAELLLAVTDNHSGLKENAVPSIFPLCTENNTSTARHEKCKFKVCTSGEKAVKQKKIDDLRTDDQAQENIADVGLLSSVANSHGCLNENGVPSIFPSFTDNNTPTAKRKKWEFKSHAFREKALKQKKIDAPQTDDQVSENIADAELLLTIANNHKDLKEKAVPSIFPLCTENNSSTAKHEKCKVKSRISRKKAVKQMTVCSLQTEDQVSENVTEAELLPSASNSHVSEERWETTQNVSNITSTSTQTSYNIMKELEKKDVQLQKLKAALAKEREKMKMLTTKFQSVRQKLIYYETNDCHQAVENIILLGKLADSERAKFLTEQILNFF